MAEHDPADCLPRGCGRERFPVRRRHFLHPAQVNGVVNVVLLVDVPRLHRDGDFERMRRKFRFQIDTVGSTAGNGKVTIAA